MINQISICSKETLFPEYDKIQGRSQNWNTNVHVNILIAGSLPLAIRDQSYIYMPLPITLWAEGYPFFFQYDYSFKKLSCPPLAAASNPMEALTIQKEKVMRIIQIQTQILCPQRINMCRTGTALSKKLYLPWLSLRADLMVHTSSCPACWVLFEQPQGLQETQKSTIR